MKLEILYNYAGNTRADRQLFSGIVEFNPKTENFEGIIRSSNLSLEKRILVTSQISQRKMITGADKKEMIEVNIIELHPNSNPENLILTALSQFYRTLNLELNGTYDGHRYLFGDTTNAIQILPAYLRVLMVREPQHSQEYFPHPLKTPSEDDTILI